MERDFTEQKRGKVSDTATSIYKFLENVVQGNLPGCTALDKRNIRQAYHKFSSRSNDFPYSLCRLGPHSLCMNPAAVLHAFDDP